jgi:NUMOD4 motif/HNH endonuclease
MIEEVWKDIPGYEGCYQASTFGRIKRLERLVISKTGQRTLLTELIKIPTINSSSYLTIKLSVQDVRKSYLVHRLILITFVSNPENKKTVNHIDGNKVNNHISNLEWATDSEQRKHAHKIGLMTNKGSKNPRSIIKLNDGFEIINKHQQGATVKQLCKEYSVVGTTILKIINRQHWTTKAQNKSVTI